MRCYDTNILKEKLNYSALYFNLTDVQQIYIILNNGYANGCSAFLEEAKKIAYRIDKKNPIHYEFRNEEALFQLFRKHLPKQMEQKQLSSWGHVMQYIS